MPPPDEQDLPNQHNSKEGSVPIIHQNAKNIYNFASANDNKFGDSECQLTSQTMEELGNNVILPNLLIPLSELDKDLEKSYEQIELVVNYSKISNLFLRLKSECLDVIVQQQRGTTLDATSLDLLITCHEQTENIIDSFCKIKNYFKEINISCNSNFLWLENIKTANEIIETICKSPKQDNHKQLLENANDFVTQILDIYPYEYNLYLNNAASNLDLFYLIEKLNLTLICQNINVILGNEKHSHIQEKINLLKDLDLKFTQIIKINSLWQEIKQNLDRLVISEDNYKKLQIHKIHIIKLSNVQHNNLEERWQPKFKNDYTNFEDAISNKDLIKIRQFFQIYQNSVKRHFYRNSIELQDLCGKLQSAINVLLSIIKLIK